MYETREVMVVAEDGESITLVVPTKLLTEERAELLRAAFSGKVAFLEIEFLDDHWKGRVRAKVPSHKPELADLAAEAMTFMGAIVDKRYRWKDELYVESEGYWAHGF